MREWREATLARIESSCSRAGCWRSGSAPACCCRRLAPAVEEYWGTDFAAPVIEKLGAELARRPRAGGRVELRCRPADDLDGLPSGFFDTIVINSVIQYFPSVEYLTTVLNGALDLLAPGGALFVGDVRNLRLARTFHTAIQRARGTAEAELERAVERGLRWRRNCWSTRTTSRTRGSAARLVRTKRARHHNELSRHRYDVVLYAGEPDLRSGGRADRRVVDGLEPA